MPAFAFHLKSLLFQKLKSLECTLSNCALPPPLKLFLRLLSKEQLCNMEIPFLIFPSFFQSLEHQSYLLPVSSALNIFLALCTMTLFLPGSMKQEPRDSALALLLLN